MSQNQPKYINYVKTAFKLMYGLAFLNWSERSTCNKFRKLSPTPSSTRGAQQDTNIYSVQDDFIQDTV